jgi:predicted ATPase
VLAIPATLQEALLARLDRLSTARQIAQLGATLGREFSYELLRAVTPTSETDLQNALAKLVEAEILYQRGVGEQTRYFFKHALIQDTAYQSLLKSTRQQYHQQIAQVLEEHFPETKEVQSELLAHHYTEANLVAQAIPYWQQAGERAMQRSAYVEATNHFNQGIALLRTLPDTVERLQQEVRLQSLSATTWLVAKGVSSLEVRVALTRAYDLCTRLADPVHLFNVLVNLRLYTLVRGEAHKALEYSLQLMQIAQQGQDSGLLLQGYVQLGLSYFFVGEQTLACEHLKQALALYDPVHHRSHALLYLGIDPKMASLGFSSMSLWLQGYPDQALRKGQEAVRFSRGLSHPYSLAGALIYNGWTHLFRQEEEEAQKLLAEASHLNQEQGFPDLLALSMGFQGCLMIHQGKAEAGTRKIQEVLSSMEAVGLRGGQPTFLTYQAEGHMELRQTETGLSVITQALELAEQSGERYYEPELYRLKGQLTLQKFQASSSKFPPAPNPQGEAEACFQKAIDIARQQQAKSWELRAATSLARLWQQQGKRADALTLLLDVYNWFTEGFDTKDLQEAKALLDELGME